jgi:N-acetylglucosaminyl-diphospho-decaprenol L-rhamnosyltransferase
MSVVREESLRTTCAVVLNWNLAHMTVRCVRALVDDGLDQARIVVVDNGSTDESAERLEQEVPETHLVRLDQNVGYAKASNVGARALADAKTFLFVNNDAFVHRPGAVARLLAALEHGAGLTVPRLLNEDLTPQPSVVPLSSPATALVRATGLSRFIPNRWQPQWSTHWDHRSSRFVDAAAGTVVAVRGDVWRQLGGYTEREFMYSEDIDLCWRARKLGYRTLFEADSEFVHLGNASGRRSWTTTERAELVARSDASMIRTELGPVRSALTIGFLSFGLLGRLVFFKLVRDQTSAAWTRATLQGYRKSAGAPRS